MERLALPLLIVALSGCGPSEAEARKHLQEDGLEVTKLEKDGEGFKFTANKGDQICDGTLTLKKGFGSTSFTQTATCKRDTSACKAGAAAECVKIADELYAQDAKVYPKTAAELYRTACADDNGHACARVAEFEAIGKSWKKVREYANKSCDLGDGDGCVRLGFRELNGEGGDKNRSKAIELFQKGCDKGNLRGCRAAAGLILDDDGDLETAAKLAKVACDAKHDDSCYVLGLALFHGKKDYAGALKHLTGACTDDALDNKKRGEACNLNGAIHKDGHGVDKDAVKALPLFEKGCELGSGNGCINAGNQYKKGDGVARDAAKAKELFAEACKLGKKEHCGG